METSVFIATTHTVHRNMQVSRFGRR